ncbi:homoserine dehydrogenase [Acetobacter sp. AN02]|uniref:homoserine dehydrogenase n=1 Tax=Acetobacter sp. AN02 TaxID=2894186 RepID=UPI002434256C|nr:homoserine dehydrogenase [Acetobacter sp. AN02]MDG6095229.1 homoserine dehydrogenase [Acetobacter sp. AN02]
MTVQDSSQTVLRLGIAGLGTVGAGVIRLLTDNADLITARAGRRIEVTAVAARDRSRDRGVKLDHLRWYEDAADLAADPEVDVVVELIGGSEGVARTLVTDALRAGRPVVTANKALVAVYGDELAALSEKHDAPLLFEAAVAGGIPAIKTVREGLAADRLTRVGGILNGTCNYILTTMRETGRDFSDVLAEAQALGYAEADPSTDVDGIDAAHKLSILAALAFGRFVDFDSLTVQGIGTVSALDFAFARDLGYRIKLLGVAQQSADGIEARVSPCLIAENLPIAQVDGVFNAVLAEGNFVGNLMLEGRGAGAGPTAVAVCADIIDIARGATAPIWGVRTAAHREPLRCLPPEHSEGAFYLRLTVEDKAGVLADITAILREYGISLSRMLQTPAEPDGEKNVVPLVLMTHRTTGGAMQNAVSRIAALPVVYEQPNLMRVEEG